jgi:hypothetical protein
MTFVSNKPKIRAKFVDFVRKNPSKNNNSIYRLLDKKFEIDDSPKPDFLIYSHAGREHLLYNCVKIYYTNENTRPNFNECDYAFSFDYPINDRNYRLPNYFFYGDVNSLRNRKLDWDDILAAKTGFCNFVYSNIKATKRIRFFKKLSSYKKVNSGGRVFNNIGYLVDDKIDFLSNHKFTIAFENSSYPGYTTEKILHPFLANSVPIYWGNPLVSNEFNPEAFINCHDYANFDEVIKKIIEIDNDDELYKKYLRAPVFNDDKVPWFLQEDAILDKFEQIFSNKEAQIKPHPIRKFRYHWYNFKMGLLPLKQLVKIRKYLVRNLTKLK